MSDEGIQVPYNRGLKKEGEVLGQATAAVILASPAFQADLVEVKAELKL